jgi:hypothetical protein
MQACILDFDGAITSQFQLVERFAPEVIPLEDWGPRIRIACSFTAYCRFESSLQDRLRADAPGLILYGSGDFHHVSLALLRRLRQPFNLLVLDKHPDWMRGIPVMHCGTWLHHALQLPSLQCVYHLGGDLDFDNLFRWLAPWRDIQSGRIRTFPAVRRYTRGRWRDVATDPLRVGGPRRVTEDRLEELLGSIRADLARHPLYISLDKDVMQQGDAIVNWDSGHLELPEVQTILRWFVAASGGRLAGMDIVGDWSPVYVRGLLRRIMHWTEHPAFHVRPEEACGVNGTVNAALLENALRPLGSQRNSAFPHHADQHA